MEQPHPKLGPWRDELERLLAANAEVGARAADVDPGVRRAARARFVPLPRRCIVERTLTWISRNRRLARDFERYARTAAAVMRLAMICLMLRRLG